ncbi:MAG TPA: BREX system ATP-binding domain-containing protein [Streptosporangiaceae bacterium]|nr:BREX system ATP-binding domain-containing protein [Streptosporangiaceae bacterium]
MPARAPWLRGRETETGVLREALDRVASGGQAIVLVEGEAGIGKTRLLEEVLADAAARGMQVAAARAEELEQARPFGLMTGAFGCVQGSGDPRRAAIAGLLSASGGRASGGPVTVTSDPGLQFRVVDAFGDLVEALALSGPVVVGADDLQWADPSSLVTLAAMGRRVADLPVGIIGCFRPVPRAAELDGAVRALQAAGARHLTLPPLGAVAVGELVSEMVSAEPGPGLLAEISGAAGNPLFVTELLAALQQEGAIQVIGGRAEVAEATLPPTLRLTILRRLSFLPEDTLQVLRAASILGSAFSLTDLALISGRPAIELTAALTEAIRSRVVEDDGAQLRFRHDLIRGSIYEDLPASVRRGLHREAAVRLAQSGTPALRVAEHFARGAAEGDSEAIEWLARAARDAAPGSPAAAASLLDRAITLMQPGDPRRDRLLTEQARSVMLAGRITDAETISRRLLDRRHDPAVEGAARMCLARALLAQGRHRDGLAEMERAAESPLLTEAEHAAARAFAGFARLSTGDLAGAARQASAVALAADDPFSASIAMSTLAMISESRGQLADALRSAYDALRLATDSLARHGRQYPVQVSCGYIMVEADRLEEARSTLHAGRRISEERGIRWPLPTFGVILGLERFVAGQWDDALAELESCLELAGELGEENYTVNLAHAVMALVSFHRDDLNRAAAAAQAANQELTGRGTAFARWTAWPRALLQEASGQPAQALETLATPLRESTRLGISAEYPVMGADLVRLAVTEGDISLARQVAAAVGDVASRNDLAWLRGAALRCQGLAESDPNVLAAAADAYAEASRPLELALASEDAAAAFVRQGEPERARPLLEQAIAIYERLDAYRDLARANAVLRLAGLRRGVRGPRKRPQFGWQSLTPTERTVAALVADGLTNPQIGERLFISRRTVQAHLVHVFAKLGISARAQLAAQVARQREAG